MRKDTLRKGMRVAVADHVIDRVNGQRAAIRAQYGSQMVKPLPDLPYGQMFRIVDMMDRKTCDIPTRVGVAWPDRGLAFGVELADIISTD